MRRPARGEAGMNDHVIQSEPCCRGPVGSPILGLHQLRHTTHTWLTIAPAGWYGWQTAKYISLKLMLAVWQNRLGLVREMLEHKDSDDLESMTAALDDIDQR